MEKNGFCHHFFSFFNLKNGNEYTNFTKECKISVYLILKYDINLHKKNVKI